MKLPVQGLKKQESSSNYSQVQDQNSENPRYILLISSRCLPTLTLQWLHHEGHQVSYQPLQLKPFCGANKHKLKLKPQCHHHHLSLPVKLKL